MENSVCAQVCVVVVVVVCVVWCVWCGVDVYVSRRADSGCCLPA